MCPNKDHCGPMVTPWKDGIWLAIKTRFLSRAVPDNLFGVDISMVCKVHDEEYERGGSELDKRVYDNEFRENIYNFINNGLLKQGYTSDKAHILAYTVAKLYYLGVRTKTADKQFNWSPK